MKKEEARMRRQIILLGLVLAVWVLSSEVSPIQAQSYPDRSIQLIILGAP